MDVDIGWAVIVEPLVSGSQRDTGMECLFNVLERQG